MIQRLNFIDSGNGFGEIVAYKVYEDSCPEDGPENMLTDRFLNNLNKCFDYRVRLSDRKLLLKPKAQRDKEKIENDKLKARSIRNEKDSLLIQTDRMVSVPDYPITSSQLTELLAYRQLLWNDDDVIPTKPTWLGD